MNSEELTEFGLSNTEAKVYLALVQLNRSQAGNITKESGVNRTNVYDALERLIEKGLVSYVTENNKKVFEAVSPERFKLVVEEKQEKLLNVIKQLKEKSSEKKQDESATILRGKNGVKSVYDDVLKEKKEVVVYGAQSKFKDMFPFYQEHWNKKRAELGIKLRIIWSEKVRGQRKELRLLKKRFLPDSYDFPSTTMIYGDKVATIVWTETPFAFVIKSKEAVKSSLNYFNLLWGTAKK